MVHARRALCFLCGHNQGCEGHLRQTAGKLSQSVPGFAHHSLCVPTRDDCMDDCMDDCITGTPFYVVQWHVESRGQHGHRPPRLELLLVVQVEAGINMVSDHLHLHVFLFSLRFSHVQEVHKYRRCISRPGNPALVTALVTAWPTISDHLRLCACQEDGRKKCQ